MPTTALLQGDAAKVLATLPHNSVHCVVTSIPYFSLREYLPAEHPDKQYEIGNEADVETYLAAIVAVFDALWPVLRDDGTLWLNAGDKYANDRKWGGATSGKHTKTMYGKSGIGRTKVKTNEPAKSLIGIPWRIVFALKARGWILRQEIIWHKTNTMPNSHTDRFTTAHEPIFLFTKQPHYYIDMTAIAEPAKQYQGQAATFSRQGPVSNHVLPNQQAAQHRPGHTWRPTTLTRNARDVWNMAVGRNPTNHFATFPIEIPLRAISAGTSAIGCCPACGSPWRRTINKTFYGQPDVDPSKLTKASRKGLDINNGWAAAPRGAHHIETTGWEPTCTCSTSEPALEPGDLDIINTPTGARNGKDPTIQTGRAGWNRPRGAAEGQRPITRYEQRQYAQQLKTSPHREDMAAAAGAAFAHYLRTDHAGARPIQPELLTTWLANGWLTPVTPPTITPHTPIPCVVCDPFAGSGTTLIAAQQLGRDGLGIDLNPEYIELMRNRLKT